ncbi:MAG: CocE/NonD family hydrolase C-terminal non-catalytic domain-containing protein [Desulfotomaculales bacterium]
MAPFKKLLITGPAHLKRPWISFHDEVLRWYNYWLKGIDTGILEEPRVKIWTMGANRWRYADDWPLPQTKWTRLYLDCWERLRWEPFTEASGDGMDEPDCFVQMPLKTDQNGAKTAVPDRPPAGRHRGDRAAFASFLGRNRPGRHQLDYRD